MPLPNQGYNTAQAGYAWQPNTGNFMSQQPQQNTAQPWPNNWGQPQMQQQQITSRVMSIAPASSRENAQQFPVAVNTDLYLVNRQEMKLYFKNNPANPSEMEEFDLVKVEKIPDQNDPVTRSELEELKLMMGQMMNMIQGGNQQNHQKNQRYSGKRGNNHDRSEHVSADDE